MLRYVLGDGLDARSAADVPNFRTRADERLFLGGLDHPHLHRRLAGIDEFHVRQRRLELCARRAREVIELDANSAALRTQ